MSVAVESSGLTVRFGELTAVDGLDLEVAAGTVFGFLGPNGAGKSTTIRLLLGLLEPTSGSASIGGFDVATHGDDARGCCGVLLDDDGLYDRLTAAENLELAGRIARMPSARRRTRTAELLEHIGLSDRADEQIAGWSLGMRKKLAVSRAVYARPPVVFLDEPANGLDPTARRALREDIRSLTADEQTTVFVTTHDLADAELECDVVGVMRAGRLVAQGAPDELRRRRASSTLDLTGTGFGPAVGDAIAKVPRVRSIEVVGDTMRVTLDSSDAAGAPVVAAAVSAGAALEEVRRASSSLEDVFVELTGDGDQAAAAAEDDT
jgi:ABC-2 type transport system ATP-binding protein